MGLHDSPGGGRWCPRYCTPKISKYLFSSQNLILESLPYSCMFPVSELSFQVFNSRVWIIRLVFLMQSIINLPYFHLWNGDTREFSRIPWDEMKDVWLVLSVPTLALFLWRRLCQPIACLVRFYRGTVCPYFLPVKDLTTTFPRLTLSDAGEGCRFFSWRKISVG